MTPNEYQQLASSTESRVLVSLDDKHSRLIHAAIGMCTESGEFIDALKKHIFYGKPLDYVNLEEELGDLMWYVAIAANALDADLGEIMDRNIQKLKTRYPNKFTSEDAINRDIAAERAVLEGK